MTNFIDNFIDQNTTVAVFLDEVGRDYAMCDKSLDKFKQFLIDTKYNAALGTDLANFLQCLTKKENYSDFELNDIGRLFDSLLKLQEFNIDTYVEAGHFEWAVMDNKEKATQIIRKGIDRAKEKTEELQRLLNTIEHEG
jgi:hypothetical protein